MTARPSASTRLLAGVRALVGDDLGALAPVRWKAEPPPIPGPRVRVVALVAYYLAIVAGLVAVYGLNPPSPPPFIYQGF